MTGSVSYVEVACITVDHPSFTAACLEGFTQDLPPKDEWSRFSARSISPDSAVVFTAVKFMCNGTLEALNVPIELRGSDYQFWDRKLIIDVMVWRQSKARIARIETVRIAERIDNRDIEMFDDETIMLNESAVVQFIENMHVNIDIMEGDIMGAIVPRTRRLVNVSGTVDNTVAEHLALLFQSDTQIPLISATFLPSTSPMTDEGQLQYCIKLS